MITGLKKVYLGQVVKCMYMYNVQKCVLSAYTTTCTHAHVCTKGLYIWVDMLTLSGIIYIYKCRKVSKNNIIFYKIPVKPWDIASCPHIPRTKSTCIQILPVKYNRYHVTFNTPSGVFTRVSRNQLINFHGAIASSSTASYSLMKNET